MRLRGIGLIWLAVAVMPWVVSAAERQSSPMADAEIRDWSGRLNQATLADKSVISEYIAFTTATNEPAARLEIGFSPRFNCTPMIRVLLPDSVQAASPTQTSLQLLLDRDNVDFPFFLDSLPEGRLHAFAASAVAQEALRQQLDIASHLRMTRDEQAQTDNTAAGQDAGTIHFSLLGSRRSVAAAQSRCQDHVPLPYTYSPPAAGEG